MQPENNSGQISIQQLTDWVLTHRRGKAFYNWTPNEIAQALYEAMLNNEMLVAFDPSDSNSIWGIVHGHALSDKKIFHVSNMLILPNTKGVIKSFLGGMDLLWPGYKLEGQRYGKIKHYDMGRFKRHIQNLN